MSGIVENIRFTDMIAVANAAADWVSISSGTGIPTPFINSTAKPFFVDGDNVIVESITLKLPYAFGAADSPFLFLMGAADVTLVPIPLPEFGGGGLFAFSIPQWEFAQPLYIPQPAALSGGKWALTADCVAGANRISMIYCPPALDGDDLLPMLWLKIRHNFPMIA